MTAGHKTIAVSGTHGKTTTTAMITRVLEEAGLDPYMILGSLLKEKRDDGSEYYTNYREGSRDYFVIEACEYRRSFLNVNPYILIITNIEADHLDYYKDLDDIENAFSELVSKIPNDGYLICDIHHKNMAKVLESAKCQVIDYKPNIPEYSLNVPGHHNKMDAGCADAVGGILNIDKNVRKKALISFDGTWRRFEFIGHTEKGAVIYDDYAHHPSEVRATLEGARELFPEHKILVAFHPHLYSRTKQFLTDFGKCFGDASEVVIAPIFPARETFDPTISSEILANEIKKSNIKALALPSFDEIEKYLRENTSDGDVIITMGAGDIYKVAQKLKA